jgi:hypothetical protein
MKVTPELLDALKAKTVDARDSMNAAENFFRNISGEVDEYPANAELPAQFLVDLGNACAEARRARNKWEATRSAWNLAIVAGSDLSSAGWSGTKPKPRRLNREEAARVLAIIS